MAKGNQKYEREATEKEQAKYGAEYDSFMNQFLGRTPTAANTSAMETKNSFSKKGGMGAIGASVAARRGIPGVTGEAAPRETGPGESSRYKDILQQGNEERGYLSSGLRGMAESGGMDPNALEDFRSRYQGALGGGPAQATLSDFADERKRYTDFADTGGYSAGDISRVRAQAAGSAPKLYEALKSQNQLAQSRMGANAGAGAGFDFKNARAAAQQAGQDKLAANIGLAESQRAGKQFGIQGLESTGTTMGNQSLSQAGLNNQYNLGAADITANAERQIADMQQKGKISGYQGLMDLYGTSYEPENQFNKTWLDAVGASSSSAKGNRELQLKNDEVNRSRAMENAIGLAGAVAGGMTGMGGIMNAVGGMAGGGGQAPTGQPVMNNMAFQGALGQNAFNAPQYGGQQIQPARNNRLTNNYFNAPSYPGR